MKNKQVEAYISICNGNMNWYLAFIVLVELHCNMESNPVLITQNSNKQQSMLTKKSKKLSNECCGMN